MRFSPNLAWNLSGGRIEPDSTSENLPFRNFLLYSQFLTRIFNQCKFYSKKSFARLTPGLLYRTQGLKGTVVLPFVIDDDGTDTDVVVDVIRRGEVLFFKGEVEKTLRIRLLPPKLPSDNFVITIALGETIGASSAAGWLFFTQSVLVGPVTTQAAQPISFAALS